SSRSSGRPTADRSMRPTDAPPDPDLALDAFLERFETAYARSSSADPADFLPPPGHPLYAEVLRELVRIDLEFAWDRGEERRLEAYRGRFPGCSPTPTPCGRSPGRSSGCGRRPAHAIGRPSPGATRLAALLAVSGGPAGRPDSGKGLVSTLAGRAARVSTDAASSGAPPVPPVPPPAAAEKPPTGLSRETLARL